MCNCLTDYNGEVSVISEWSTWSKWHVGLEENMVGVVRGDSALRCHLDVSGLWPAGTGRPYKRLFTECWHRETEVVYRTKTSSKSQKLALLKFSVFNFS